MTPTHVGNTLLLIYKNMEMTFHLPVPSRLYLITPHQAKTCRPGSANRPLKPPSGVITRARVVLFTYNTEGIVRTYSAMRGHEVFLYRSSRGLHKQPAGGSEPEGGASVGSRGAARRVPRPANPGCRRGRSSNSGGTGVCFIFSCANLIPYRGDVTL